MSAVNEEPATVGETDPADSAVDTPQSEPQPSAAPKRVLFKEFGGYFWGTGRRKTSVARVRVRPGSGVFIVKGRPMDQYFPLERQQRLIMGPLVVAKLEGKVDVFVNVTGGGITGQTGAVMMGLARALTGVDPNCEIPLRVDGYLTRDSRMVERKKYGQRGARRGFQFSKR